MISWVESTNFQIMLKLRRDIDVNLADSRGRVPAVEALERNHTEILLELFNRPDFDGGKLLLPAAMRGLTSIVRRLLKRPEVDVYTRDELGETALTLASTNGHLTTVAFLLASAGNMADALLLHRNSEGMPAVLLAALNGHGDVVELIKKAWARRRDGRHTAPCELGKKSTMC